MLALQGQDLAGAKWSVGVRVAGATEAMVDAAFDAGDIVRSWPMRGTLHVVAAEDLGWLLALTSARMLASAASRRSALGITDRDVERAREIVVSELSGRRTLARRALLQALDAGGVATTGQRGYHLLWYLAQTGTLVLGASHATGQAFALLEEWVPYARPLERDEALGELVLRYVRSHGPVTVSDIARWVGLTITDIRRGLVVAGGHLTSVAVDGTDYHVAPELLDLDLHESRGLQLLPGFDEYLLGYGDRSASLPAEHADLVVPGGNGMFRPTIVVDGEVVGTWSRTIRSGDVAIATRLFPGVQPVPVEAIAAAAERFGAFVGRPAHLV